MNGYPLFRNLRRPSCEWQKYMEDKIDFFKIYSQVFSCMDKLYFSNRNCYDTGNIGVLLGQMNPFLCGAGKTSADGAWFSEFSKRLKSKPEINLKSGFGVIKDMLNEYDDETYMIHNYLKDYEKFCDCSESISLH